MIKGIGVDLCVISRIKNAMEISNFREKVFTSEEIAYAESRGVRRFDSYAANYAAREAFVKASGAPLHKVVFDGDFALLRSESGAPYIKLSGGLRKYAEHAKIHVSITHEGDCACAMVVIEEIN